MKFSILRSHIICIIFLIGIVLNSSSQTTTSGLRYFMQNASLQGSIIAYGNNPHAGHYLNTGDAKIYYEVYGKGKPLVILHGGIVGSSYEMGQLIDSLSKRFQIISISTRGHGKSEMGSGLPTYERKAADVNALLNAVTKDSAIVLGFSDGAYIGYFLASSYPQKVKKLIAIGAGEWKHGFRFFNNTRKVLFSFDSLYFKQQLKLAPQPERFDEWLDSLNKYYNSVSVGAKTLERIKCPVLVMAGEKDQNAALETVLAAYKMIPNAQLSIIPNAPHPVFLTNFPAVWASVAPFVNY